MDRATMLSQTGFGTDKTVHGEFFARSARPSALDRFRRLKGVQNSLAPSRSTSDQMAGLALAETVPPTGAHGILLGVDVMYGAPVVHDPFAAYTEMEGFSSPNVTLFGDLGSGKSQFAKAWICRNLMLGRRVIVLDKKPQKRADGSSEGEYALMARALGYTPVALSTGGGGVRVNILDPRISANTVNGAGSSDKGAAGQQMLLESVIVAAMGRSLSEEERKAVRVARASAVERARHAGEVAHVGHVVHELLSPSDDVAQACDGIDSVEELRAFGRAPGFALERLVEDELSGLIDGPTDPRLDLRSQLTVFDISALPDDGSAVPIMMNVLDTLAHSMIAASESSIPTLFVTDEAWHVVDGDYAKVARRNNKIARGLGLSNVSIFQHLSDIPTDSPAVAMIKESQTVVVFRQSKTDDAAMIAALLGWSEEDAERLTVLDTGVAMMKIASRPPVICKMQMSDFELTVGDTNEAMTSRATFQARDETEAEQNYGVPTHG